MSVVSSQVSSLSSRHRLVDYDLLHGDVWLAVVTAMTAMTALFLVVTTFSTLISTAAVLTYLARVAKANLLLRVSSAGVVVQLLLLGGMSVNFAAAIEAAAPLRRLVKWIVQL